MDFLYSMSMADEPSWMTSLLYPLIMLGIGTVITYILGTTLTRKYQEKQRTREIEREDYHHSISIKDDMIRQFSDTIVILEKIVICVKLLHEAEKSKDWREVLINNFDEFQLKTGKLMLLINLYFGIGNKVSEEFSIFVILVIIIKNYGFQDDKQEREKLKNNIIKYIEILSPKDTQTITEKTMKEIGLPIDFYTEITTKIGSWSVHFSKTMLDTKFKTQN